VELGTGRATDSYSLVPGRRREPPTLRDERARERTTADRQDTVFEYELVVILGNRITVPSLFRDRMGGGHQPT